MEAAMRKARAVTSSEANREAASKPRRRRRASSTRARPVPKWLLTGEGQEEMARRRLLMVLSVLSGEKAVTDVIAEAAISRGTYYQLEEKALRAMLVALLPASGPEGTEESALETAKGQIQELEERVKRLGRGKGRAGRRRE